MLARLSIRAIVLIDRLDIDFTLGLSVLTGATGAGRRTRRAAMPPVLVSTFKTSVTCGPRCPAATRTSKVSPGCTA